MIKVLERIYTVQNLDQPVKNHQFLWFHLGWGIFLAMILILLLR